MQKCIVMLGLLLSIARASYAQERASSAQQKTPADDRLFELPPYTTSFKAWADLGQGNTLRLELTSREELLRFENIDSLLLVFFNDIKPLQDSLSDPQTTKRIDYLLDAEGLKKLRLRQSKPFATTYLLGDGEPALLRLQQDTVFLLLPVPAEKSEKSAAGVQRYDRLGFFLNRYEELNGLITTGLNRKITLMQTKEGKEGWTYKNDQAYLKADPSISTRTFLSSGRGTQLELRYHVSIQNYKNYFTPSFCLGATITINNRGTRDAFSLDWEPVFLFAHDAQGRLQTYRNDFLVLGYSNRKAEPPGIVFKNTGPDASPQNALNLDLNFSLGYLIYSEGGYVARHTFRLCVGSASLVRNRIIVQPCMFFNDFFKGVTPGIRVSF
jgi:hypothetical protein